MTKARSPFTLQAFESDPSLEKISIKGLFERDQEKIRVKFDLTGDHRHLVLPKPSKSPERRNELWTNTCFEVFVAEVGQLSYWEWNFSPALHWNLFYFKDYRNPLEIPAPWDFEAIPLASKNHLQLSLKFKLPQRLHHSKLEIGLHAVLHHKQKGLSYWALKHLSQKPDFHNRGGFVILA